MGRLRTPTGKKTSCNFYCRQFSFQPLIERIVSAEYYLLTPKDPLLFHHPALVELSLADAALVDFDLDTWPSNFPLICQHVAVTHITEVLEI